MKGKNALKINAGWKSERMAALVCSDRGQIRKGKQTKWRVCVRVRAGGGGGGEAA